MDILQEKINKAIKEDIKITAYNKDWPKYFDQERVHLLNCLPKGLIKRIEHFGSTAIPGMAAKPIIDIMVEVTSLEQTKKIIVPVLEKQGYDYFWRPTFGDNIPPFYAWFIKRNHNGIRTHHIHMVEKDFTEHWERLDFRDHLIAYPEVAKQYEDLKIRLSEKHPHDRVAYTSSKTEFINKVTQSARQELKNK